MLSTTRRGLLYAAGAAALGSITGCTAPAARTDGIDRPSGVATEADAQFRRNLRRQGAQLDEVVPDTVAVDWRLDAVNTGDHTAAKASAVPSPRGDLIVPGDTGTVHAVRPDGSVRWETTVYNGNRGIHGTPAIANGTVYVGAYDGTMYALDVQSGDLEWSNRLGDAIGSSPAYHDGLVYIAVEYAAPSGRLFALDATDGRVVWVDPRPTDHPHSTTAIDRDSGRVAVGSNDGNLYAWSYPDMIHRFTFETERPIKGPIAVFDGMAVFGSWDEHVYAVALDDRYDVTEGEAVWTFETGSLVMSGPAVDTDRETLYVGSHDSNLYALDARTGSQEWAHDTAGRIIGCPTVTRDHVLVGSYDRSLYAVDKEDGSRVWMVRNDGRVTSSPVVRNGAVYFAERRPESDPDGDGGFYKLVASG